jgi:hypothetical protein
LLAYVFWHVPRAGVAARAYESAHREFHDALGAAGLAGLIGVEIFRLPGIPWLEGASGYEDWHFLEDSCSLDALNRAAVSAARQGPHDRVAAMAGHGTAGLYGLRMGSRITPVVACWLSKPDGMPYATFEASLAPHIAEGCCLWGRRMTLGPTPEFCLHAPASRELPYPARTIHLTPMPLQGSSR